MGGAIRLANRLAGDGLAGRDLLGWLWRKLMNQEMKVVAEPRREIPVAAECDVLVAGAAPPGLGPRWPPAARAPIPC